MSNYTKDSENIYMLNDKCIVQSLTSDAELNAIPSQQLFKETYDILSSDDKFISAYIDKVELSTSALSTYVKNNVVKKNGDTIIGDLTVNGIVKSIKSHVNQENDDAYTHVSVDVNGVTVNLSGEARKLTIDLTHSINDIVINGDSLSTHIKNDVDAKTTGTLISAKYYTDEEIQKLNVQDLAVDKKFVTAVSETDGKIVVSRAELSASDIPELPEVKITNLTSDLNDRLLTVDFKTTLINNDGKLLSAENFNFTYDSNTHLIWLYAGDNHLSVDANDFIRNRVLYKASIEVDPSTAKQTLFLYFKDPTDPTYDESKDLVKIPIEDLTKIYRGSTTISIDTDLAIHTTDEVALTSQVSTVDNKITNLNFDNQFDSTKTEVVTSLTQSSGKIAYVVKELDNTMVKGLSDYVSQQIQLSVNSLDKAEISEGNKLIYAVSEENGIVSAASRYLSKEDFGYTSDTLPGNLLKKSQIENLPVELQALSDDVALINDAAIKDLKFVKHIIPVPETTHDSIAHFFAALNLFTKDSDKVKNGSIYDVQLSGSYQLSDQCIIDDGDAKLILGNGDWLIVHSHTNNAYVSASELTSIGDNKSLYVIKAGVSRYEFEKELKSRNDGDTRISTWISANFENGEVLDPTIDTINKKDTTFNKTVTIVGNTYAADLSANDISVGTLITNNADISSENVINSSMKNVGISSEYVADSVVETLSVTDETAINGNISSLTNTDAVIVNAGISTLNAVAANIDFDSIIDKTGSTVQDISNEASCKIWIKNPTTEKYANGDYANLSVVKIPITDYELSVVGGTLCNDVLYIVSADYIDAYAEELCNLYTPGIEGTSNAANTLYVKNEISLLVNSLNNADSVVEHQFVTAVSETNGIISVSRNALISDDIPELPETKITHLTNDLTAYQQSLSNYTLTKFTENDELLELSAKINTIIDALHNAFGLKIS